MKVAILAGEAGTRLYPISAYVPKALIPIGSKCVIEYMINFLGLSDIIDIVILTSHESMCTTHAIHV